MAEFDTIVSHKSEPAVQVLKDDLMKSDNIATLTFLADALVTTKVLQTVLQGVRLN